VVAKPIAQIWDLGVFWAIFFFPLSSESRSGLILAVLSEHSGCGEREVARLIHVLDMKELCLEVVFIRPRSALVAGSAARGYQSQV
jgi:hypothetical protein